MTSELHDLVRAWVQGWCLSRGITATAWHDGWLAVVSAETRALEYLLVEPSDADVERAVAAVHDRSDVWLTVIGHAPERAAQELHPVTHSERFLVKQLAATGTPDRVGLHVEGDVAFATVSVDGQRAAWGQVAVTPDGVAVIDRIGTDPAYRRQGLASQVMAGLETWAATRGATTGALFASQEGRRLYASLGWREIADLGTWRGGGRSS